MSHSAVASKKPYEEPLSRFSLFDGAVHGFYMGIWDSIVPALLVSCNATAVFFYTLTHGGYAATVFSQWTSGRKACSYENRLQVLSIITALQALFLFFLSTCLFLVASRPLLFASTICAVGVFSVAIGNYASPLWHATWSSEIFPINRTKLLARRNKIMVTATLLALTICFFALDIYSFKNVFFWLILAAGFCKASSAAWLWKMSRTYTSSVVNAPKSVSIINSEAFKNALTYTPFYYGFGIASSYLLPFINSSFHFSPSLIFALIVIQQLGQIFISTLLHLPNLKGDYSKVRVVSLLILSALPFCWCLADSYLQWMSIFFITGMAWAGLSISIIDLVHSHGCAAKAAQTQAAFVIASCSAAVAGGLSGAAILLLSPFSQNFTYQFVFLCSAIFRLAGAALLALELLAFVRPKEIAVEVKAINGKF